MRLPNNTFGQLPTEAKSGQKLRAAWLNQIRAAIGPREIRTNKMPFKNASTGNHRMYDIERDGDKFRYRPGIWERGGGVAGTRITAFPVPTYDPVAQNIITGVGNEIVWVYAVLNDSRGHALQAPVLTHDYGWSSSFWTGVATGVHVVVRDRPITDAAADRVDPFDQWKLIGQLYYEGGKLLRKNQLHRGPIEAQDPVYPTVEEDESFRTYLQYSDGAADYKTTLTPVLGVEDGRYKRRNSIGAINGLTFSFATLDGASPDDIYAYLGPEDTAWSVDRSLIPGSESIGLSNGAGVTYADYRLPLCSFSTFIDVLGQDIVYVSVRWAGGYWISDWMRPDGQVVGGALGATVDADDPKISSLDFMTTGAHKGEAQLSQAHEKLADSAGITNIDGDEAVPYIDYSTSGFSTMEYARVDYSNHATWQVSASIEINSNVLMLYDFLNAGGTETPTGDPATFFADSLILIRDNTGAYPILKYGDLTDLFDWAEGNWDEKSINPVNSKDKGQIHGFAAADTTTQAPLATDLFPFKDRDVGVIEWAKMQDMKTRLIPHYSLIRQTDEAQGGGWSDFDDHGGANALGNRINDGYALMLLGAVTSKAAMYTRNSGDNYLGDSLFVETNLYVSNIYNEDGASGWTRRIDVENCRLYETDGTTLTVDWHLRTLTGGVGEDWSVILGHKFLVLDTTGITSGTDASGACQISGGVSVVESVQAKRYEVSSDATPDNYWDSEFFTVDETDWVKLIGGGVGQFMVDGDFQIESTGSWLTLDASAQIELEAGTDIDLTAGVDIHLGADTDIELAAGADINLTAGTDINFVVSNQITINTVACIFQAAAVIGQLTVNEGFVTGFTVITPVADNTYNNPTSITTVDGHITAIS